MNHLECSTKSWSTGPLYLTKHWYQNQDLVLNEMIIKYERLSKTFQAIATLLKVPFEEAYKKCFWVLYLQDWVKRRSNLSSSIRAHRRQEKIIIDSYNCSFLQPN